MRDNRLEGLSVLIAEDEALVAMDLTDTVEWEGGRVVGPFATARESAGALDGAAVDLAILDVRLEDGEVFPFADTVRDRDIPIVFHSGHVDPGEIAARYPQARFCPKPSTPEQLLAALLAVRDHD